MIFMLADIWCNHEYNNRKKRFQGEFCNASIRAVFQIPLRQQWYSLCHCVQGVRMKAEWDNEGQVSR